MLFEAIKLALSTIQRNPLRSFLTLLGIVIGVGAVIAMVTIGNGTTAKVTADLAKLGSNLLSAQPGQFGPGRASSTAKTFNARDIEAMKTQLNGVKAVAPVAQKSVTAIYGTESRSTTVTGSDNRLLHHPGLAGEDGTAVLRQRNPRRPRRLHYRHDRARQAVRPRRSAGPQYSRRQCLLRGDRGLGHQGPVELRYRPGRHRADAAADVSTAARRQHRHRPHHGVGQGRRGNREGASRHRADLARAAAHRCPARRTTFPSSI